MNIEIKKLENNIVRYTTFGERWYYRETEDGAIDYKPSVTWIVSYYPKGIGYMKWLAGNGWDTSETLKHEAAEKGTLVHKCIQELLLGAKLDVNKGEYTGEEWGAIVSFANWFNEIKPKVLGVEKTILGKEYAGTIDIVCMIDKKIWLIDIKTSKAVYPSHELQLSAYKKLCEDMDCKIDTMAILQVGYERNKNRYKLTEVEDQYPVFLATKQIWEKETFGERPLEREYPLEIKLKVESDKPKRRILKLKNNKHVNKRTN